MRITEAGLDVMTPSGVAHTPNEGAFRAGVNRAFIEAVRTGDPTPLRAGLWEGIHSTAVVLAANQSARTGLPVKVDEFLEQQAGVKR